MILAYMLGAVPEDYGLFYDYVKIYKRAFFQMLEGYPKDIDYSDIKCRVVTKTVDPFDEFSSSNINQCSWISICLLLHVFLFSRQVCSNLQA